MTGLENIQAEILSDNRRINGELLADADQVGILDVVPLSDLHIVDTEAGADAAEDITGGNDVDDVVAVVLVSAICILHTAGYIVELVVIDHVCHFCFLLLCCVFVL